MPHVSSFQKKGLGRSAAKSATTSKENKVFGEKATRQKEFAEVNHKKEFLIGEKELGGTER